MRFFIFFLVFNANQKDIKRAKADGCSCPLFIITPLEIGCVKGNYKVNFIGKIEKTPFQWFGDDDDSTAITVNVRLLSVFGV